MLELDNFEKFIILSINLGLIQYMQTKKRIKGLFRFAFIQKKIEIVPLMIILIYLFTVIMQEEAIVWQFRKIL